MGFSYNTYVGPFVRCPITQVERQSLRSPACTNPACVNHHRFTQGQFCSLCGSRTGDVKYTELQDSVDDWEIFEAVNEVLTPAHGDAAATWMSRNGVHLWKPNVSRGDLAAGHLDDADFAVTEITPERIAVEVEEFARVFATEIAILRERYGAAEVRWGVIQDYI